MFKNLTWLSVVKARSNVDKLYKQPYFSMESKFFAAVYLLREKHPSLLSNSGYLSKPKHDIS